MSAETLRRAATQLRRDWGEGWLDLQNEETRFHLAVADWLDGVAELEERNHREMGWSPVEISDAVLVARAYLGEQP